MSKNAYQSVDAKEEMPYLMLPYGPIIKPAATMAGRIDTNTSPSVLINCFHHGILVEAVLCFHIFFTATSHSTDQQIHPNLFLQKLSTDNNL